MDISILDKKQECLRLIDVIANGGFEYSELWKANKELAKHIINEAEPGTDYMWAVDYLLEEGIEASWLAFYTGATSE